MRIRLAVLASWLAVCGLALADKPPENPTFGDVIDVNVINVDVHVTDRSGRPVADLRREDFEVFEDGKRVTVSNFEVVAPDAPPPPPPAGAPPVAAEPARVGVTEVPPEDRLHLVVYIDNANLAPANRARVLQQLRGFLADLRPEDRVMMVTADLGLTVRLPFTNDPAALAKALDEIMETATQGQESSNERRLALQRVLEIREAVRVREGPCSRSIVAPAQSYAEVTRQEVLRSINTMTVLVNSLSGVPGRKALLHVSNGLPVTPGEEVYQLLAEICGNASGSGALDVHEGDFLIEANAREALMDAQRYSTIEDFGKLAAHANAHRVTLYTLQAAGLQGNASALAEYGPEVRLLQLPAIQFVQNANLQNSLTLLASETGGRAILNANDVMPDLRRMKEDLGSYYSLGYTPAHSGDGRVHRVEVKVKKPGLQVRHRKSYRDKPAIERAVDRTLAAVYHGFEDNPLDVTVEIGAQTPAEGDRVSVPIKLRIPLFKLGIFPQPDQSYRGRLRLLVSSRDSRGGVSPIRQVEVPLQIPKEDILYAMGKFYEYELTLNLERGEQHVAITVRDEGTTTTSVLSRTLDVNAAAPAR
ncbi:MAG TPA: VWA domain-containing protein [Thermoanaerobaculia bacterium]|nr:VWA domain-containing protein [Thermoanaerobaculia bacterium]